MQGNETLKKIRSLVLECLKAGGKPGVVHISPMDEMGLMDCGLQDIGSEKLATLFDKGVRGAFPKMLGFSVKWDAEETRVEPSDGSKPRGVRGVHIKGL